MVEWFFEAEAFDASDPPQGQSAIFDFALRKEQLQVAIGVAIDGAERKRRHFRL
jgi:hypothetical protein